MHRWPLVMYIMVPYLKLVDKDSVSLLGKHNYVSVYTHMYGNTIYLSIG